MRWVQIKLMKQWNIVPVKNVMMEVDGYAKNAINISALLVQKTINVNEG